MREMALDVSTAAAPPVPTAIAVRSLSKAFRLPHEKYGTVRERVVHPFASISYETLRALQDVTFEVPRGQFFGIVGKNGGGKSTLLKCLAGIYRVDSGDVAVEGRLAPFIELGVGFHHDMAARDNVVMNAIMLGLSPREARARFEEIVAFAELEDFVDLKLKNYSSGMLMRLAFSVTVQVDADVLLFDEVLSVGDTSFQRKCFDRFDRLKDEGRTVALVTHDMETVTRFCDRALLLHEGEVVAIDEPDLVAGRYEELNMNGGARLGAARAQHDDGERQPVARGRSLWRAPQLGSLSDLRRAFIIARELAIGEFKLRYLDSVLSYLWAVLRPLAYFAVLYVFVSQVAGLNHGVRHYPAYLFTAVMLWTFFDQVTSTAVYSLVHRQDLLRKIAIPRLAIPLSVLIVGLFDLCANLVAVLVVLLISGIDPRPGWLELPVLVLLLAVLAAGTAMLLSALYVRFRDLDQIWTVATQALFFGTPIFYVITKFPLGAQRALLANPLAVVFTQMRHALIDASAPTAAAIGGAALLLVPLAVTLAVVSAGFLLFRRESPWVAEDV